MKNKIITHLSKYESFSELQYMQLMSSYMPAVGFGGPIRLMYDYARWMAKTVLRTTVITGDVHHDYSAVAPRSEVLHGIHIRRIRVSWRGLARKNINLVSPGLLLFAIWQVLRSSYRVVVHICELRGLVPLYAVLLKRIFPRKIVLVHSAFGMINYKNSSFRQVYDRRFLGLLLRSIDQALAQNNHEVGCYKELFSQHGLEKAEERIALLPLHFAERQDMSRESRNEMSDMTTLRKRYGVPEEAFVLIFLGRLHPSKGIIRAIDAFLQFSKEHSGPTYFLIVGRDDGMQQKIVEYIEVCNASSTIRIVNNVYEDRFKYYKLADLFVGFPTIFEETMLSSVEALSCGTPVLVSREADMPFVEEEGAGFVIDFTVEAAVKRIHHIAMQHSMFHMHALNMANRHFSEATAQDKFIAILDQYVNKTGRHAQ